MKSLLKPDQVTKAAGLLVGGTALGQVVLLLALPFLTRLYSPENFNILAIYVAVVGIFSGAICLRFDIAISLPEPSADAWRLMILGIWCAAVLSTLIAAGLALLLWGLSINVGVEWYIFSLIVGLGLFSMGAFNSLQMWYVREKKFLSISLVKFLQSVAVVSIQIGVGIWLATAMGLLWGQLAGSLVGAFVFIVLLSRSLGSFGGLSVQDVKRFFHVYGRFPKYSVLESLANEAASQLPLLLIAFLLGGAEAGYLMLAMRVLQAPIALLGNAISQVYLSQAPLSERKGELAALSRSMLAKLSKVGVGPLIFAAIVSPTVFPILFGSEWQRAGELVGWMTPWFIFQLLVSPISMSLHVKGKQDVALYLQLVSLLIRVAAVLLFYFFFKGFMVEAYALSGFVSYLLYFFVVLSVLGMPTKTLVNLFAEVFFYVLPFIFLAFLFVWAVRFLL